MEEKSEGTELAFVRYVQCVNPLKDIDKVLRCVCLHWAAAGSAEERHDRVLESNDRKAVVAGD